MGSRCAAMSAGSSSSRRFFFSRNTSSASSSNAGAAMTSLNVSFAASAMALVTGPLVAMMPP